MTALLAVLYLGALFLLTAFWFPTIESRGSSLAWTAFQVLGAPLVPLAAHSPLLSTVPESDFDELLFAQALTYASLMARWIVPTARSAQAAPVARTLRASLSPSPHEA